MPQESLWRLMPAADLNGNRQAQGPEICSSPKTTCGPYDQASWECSTRQAFSETRQLGLEAWIQDLQDVLPGCTWGSFLNQKEEMKGGDQVLGVPG